MTDSSTPLQFGLLVFRNVQQLDLTWADEVFASWPRARVRLIAKTLEPVTSSTGLTLKPDATFADCPQLDVVCVPGGAGINALMHDEATIAFARVEAEGVRFVTSVCTGALVLGAAGLLRGACYGTHWASHHLLETLGAKPVHARVVRDGNLVTGGGVTAGIDFALTLIAELAGRKLLRRSSQPRICACAAVQRRQSRDRAGGHRGQSSQAPAPVVEERRRLAAEAARERSGLACRAWHRAQPVHCSQKILHEAGESSSL